MGAWPSTIRPGHPAASPERGYGYAGPAEITRLSVAIAVFAQGVYEQCGLLRSLSAMQVASVTEEVRLTPVD